MQLISLEQQKKNIDHLKLLQISHYVVAGISALFSCMFLIHIAIGWGAIHNQGLFAAAQSPPPPEFGWLFFGMGIIGLLLGWVYSGLVAYTGHCIAKRQARTFVLIMAGVNCCHMPLGLVLGIFTFIVMFRDSVKCLFDGKGMPSLAVSSTGGAVVNLSSLAGSDEDVWKDLEEKARQSQQVIRVEKLHPQEEKLP